jgi:transposase
LLAGDLTGWMLLMWTSENRARYDRSKLRYPSDLTDDEWALIGPLIPPAKRGGNKRTVDMRKVVDGLMYILSTGCQWAALPEDLAPRSTVHDYFDLWEGAAPWIASITRCMCNAASRRDASATAAIVDSQSVKSAEKGGPASIRPALTRARGSKVRSVISL